MSFRQVREVRKRKRRGGKIFTALLVIAAIVAGCWYVFGRGDNNRTVHADFAFVNGLYQGSTVTVLGVPVGTIDKVEARGDHVRLTLRVREDVKLPAKVQAYVLNPSVISDRHLELGPAYTEGDTFKDGGVIPTERTHSPISWDKLMESVKTLTQVMGPGTDTARTARATRAWAPCCPRPPSRGTAADPNSERPCPLSPPRRGSSVPAARTSPVSSTAST